MVVWQVERLVEKHLLFEQFLPAGGNFHGRTAPQTGLPTTVNRTVRPKRPHNADLRTREYLTEAEVERLMEVVRGNRWGHRDATMILVAYRHGCDLDPQVGQRNVGAVSSDEASYNKNPISISATRWSL